MIEREKKIQRVIEKIQNQSEFTAKAVSWLLAHPVLTDGICDPNNRLSDEIIKREAEKAVREGDYVYYALLMYQKYVQVYGREEDAPPQ